MSRKVNVLIHSNIQNLYKNLSAEHLNLLHVIVNIASKQGITLWAVGGIIRDTVLKNQVADLDLIVEKNIFKLVNSINNIVEGVVKWENNFGTASIIIETSRVDFALPREEFYRRSASLPLIKTGVTIRKDLQRRDFNVNAMALCLNDVNDNQLHDYFNGIPSLKGNIFSTLHSLSFRDDPTRIFRAARLSILSQLVPDISTRKEIDNFKNTISLLSGKRLWNELSSIAARGSSAEVLLLLEQWEILEQIHPQFKLSNKSYSALKKHRQTLLTEHMIVIMLVSLNLENGREILKRFNAPKITFKILEDVRKLIQSDLQIDIRDLEELSQTSEQSRKIAKWLDGNKQIKIQDKVKKWENTKPFLNAKDLLSLGIPPGPDIGKILQVIREKQFCGKIQSKRQSYFFIKKYLDKK